MSISGPLAISNMLVFWKEGHNFKRYLHNIEIEKERFNLDKIYSKGHQSVLSRKIGLETQFDV